MELRRAALVLADIGHRIQLPTSREADLLHAEQHMAGLLEAVLAAIQPPLRLSKLENNGAFLFATGDSDGATAQQVSAQMPILFSAFQAKLQTLVAGRNCQCQACLNLHLLRLTVVLHFGEVIFKQVRQFNELAGEAVILLHRLNQNAAAATASVRMSESFHQLAGGLAGKSPVRRTETAKGLGLVTVWVYEFG